MIQFNDRVIGEEECLFLANWILKNEDYIKSLGPDEYGGTNENSLTGRHPYFNYLLVDEINEIIAPALKSALNKINYPAPVYVQCWANTFRTGDGIGLHKHAAYNEENFICGNLFLTGPTQPGTTYLIDNELKNIENSPGTLTLFDCHDIHGVGRNQFENIRISMAFDIHQSYDEWMNSKNRIYLLK